MKRSKKSPTLKAQIEQWKSNVEEHRKASEQIETAQNKGEHVPQVCAVRHIVSSHLPLIYALMCCSSITGPTVTMRWSLIGCPAIAALKTIGAMQLKFSKLPGFLDIGDAYT